MISNSQQLDVGEINKVIIKTEIGNIHLMIDSSNSGAWSIEFSGITYEGSTLPLQSLIGKNVVVKKR